MNVRGEVVRNNGRLIPSADSSRQSPAPQSTVFMPVANVYRVITSFVVENFSYTYFIYR
jgi:hypothetical protein